MRTGEGKTLTGTLAVVLNALAGKGVHVVTVNDYLARRDADWMRPIYEGLGLTVGILQNNQPYEEKRAAYASDITYGTNSEFGFDYLRDNMATTLEEKVQHGGRITEDGKPLAMHNYAIVDEVDNILIDEARTPLIISGAPEQAADLYDKFAKLAPVMEPGKKPEGMDPRAKKEFEADYDYEFDEKHKTVSVTEQGVAKAEKFLGIDHLYRAENGVLVNHLHQALKAESLYKKDVDYAVIDGEVKIIDEFTGRILDGRRWSEGLHQAVEAKEGVRVREENQTLATVTLQNYFRMYDKLAGMSGTALTEATEFMKIYKVGVVEIPTNRPMVRKDQNDQIYKTKRGQVARGRARDPGAPRQGPAGARRHDLGRDLRAAERAPAQDGRPAHGPQRQARVRRARGRDDRRGRAARLGHDRDQHGRPRRGHQARRQRRAPHADRAQQARPQARRPRLRRALRRHPPEDRGARGGGPDRPSRRPGGLYICGTERHESRRIDNQLRGRAGRQGDPGESRFFLSAEDDLVRLFAGDRIYKILDRLGPKGDDGEEEPIEAKMLSKQIENAQRKVEEQNYLIRKRVLEYDDVMNQQREVVYKYRDEVLEGRDMAAVAREQISEVIERLVDEYTPGDFVDDWDLDELWVQLEQIYHVDFGADEIDRSAVDREELKRMLVEDAMSLYDERESELGEELMRALERYLVLQIIDQRWREHLYDMDYLREGIHLRGFAQIEPLVAYKNEAFTLFDDLMNSIWSDFARMIYNVEVEVQGPEGEGAERRRPPPEWTPHAADDVRHGRPGLQRRHAGGPADRLRRAGRASRGGAAGRPAAAQRRARQHRAQRPVLVRLRQEVQEVPRRLGSQPLARLRHRVGRAGALRRAPHQQFHIDRVHAGQCVRDRPSIQIMVSRRR